MSDSNMTESKMKRIDEDFIRKMYESAYESHLKFAPERAQTAWKAYENASINRDRQGLLGASQQADDCVRDCLKDLCSALENVSSSAALELLFGECNDRLDEYILPKGAETFSLSRGAWLIGVFGCGQDSSRLAALKAFNKYVRWVASYLIKLHINNRRIEDETDRSIAYAVSQLEINRLVEPETRMMWITDEITHEIGRWVDRNANRISLAGAPNLATVEKISDNASRAIAHFKSALEHKSRSTSESYSEILLEGLPEKMIELLTAPNRQITETNVETALKSDAPTTLPFVRIDGAARVLGRSAWLAKRDDVMFRLVMQKSPKGKEGQIFEDVTATLLQKWGPNGINWQSSVDLVNPDSIKDTDEVDVFGASRDLTFIGECKANRLSENNSSVGSNLETVVLNKAISQLETRLEHWRSGWRPQPPNPNSADEAVGFATTFSSYGGMIWDPNKLRRDDSLVQHGVFSLYSLVLAACILEQPSDLRDYFNFRFAAMKNGVTNSDELEYMLGFVAKRGTMAMEREEDAKVLLRQYELSDQGKLIDPRQYRRKDNWKRQFLSELLQHTTPVTPSSN